MWRKLWWVGLTLGVMALLVGTVIYLLNGELECLMVIAVTQLSIIILILSEPK